MDTYGVTLRARGTSSSRRSGRTTRSRETRSTSNTRSALQVAAKSNKDVGVNLLTPKF